MSMPSPWLRRTGPSGSESFSSTPTLSRLVESNVEEVLEANRAYRRTAFLTTARTPRPSRSLVILACMDARLELFQALGLNVGEAHILRNAGGRLTSDVLRSLVVSTHLLGTREVGIIHHTDCGLEGRSNDEIASRTGVDGVEFLGFQNVDDSVRADVAALAEFDGLPDGLVVWGGVYDVDTGALNIVVPPGSSNR